MVSALIAAAVWALQTPAPPNVNLPPDWRWSSEGAGYFRTFLLGPDSQQIDYSPYRPTGYAARVMNEMNLASCALVAYLDNRRVEVSVGSSGQVIVSYPKLEGDRISAGACDYWTQTKTTRQAVKTVEITLTRLDVLGKTDRSAEESRTAAEFWPQPSAKYPFSGLGVLTGNRKLSINGHPEQFEFQLGQGEVVKLANGVPASAVWTEETPLLGRDVKVSEGADRTAWATVTSKDGKSVSFTSSQSTPSGSVLAMFAALAYKAV